MVGGEGGGIAAGLGVGARSTTGGFGDAGGSSGVARDLASIASTSARVVPYFFLETVMTSCRRWVASS